ncbi:hypothetical protein EF513_02585 [Rickettsiales endosymbiont of Stachyamoeba lipophora]|nr:hypothetical protein EF513_02585 [Rickettsiales endosymbiont of Stachyamoeba lipophora]
MFVQLTNLKKKLNKQLLTYKKELKKYRRKMSKKLEILKDLVKSNNALSVVKIIIFKKVLAFKVH